MHLRPGARITLAGLPAQWFGRSSRDLVVTGWTETWGPGTCMVALSTDAADDPAEGTWDTARWVGAGSLRLAADVTATATTITVTADPGELLTTNAADYPSTSTSPASGSGSPPPPPGRRRKPSPSPAVSPNPARAHVAGDPVDIWTPATWAL